MAQVGDFIVSMIDDGLGLVTIWIEYEVDAVFDKGDADGPSPTSVTPQRWAIMDTRRTEARDARPEIMGFTPLANQMTLDPASIVWNNLTPPQKALVGQRLVLSLLHDDRVT